LRSGETRSSTRGEGLTYDPALDHQSEPTGLRVADRIGRRRNPGDAVVD
jgi:hypothetical protein